MARNVRAAVWVIALGLLTLVYAGCKDMRLSFGPGKSDAGSPIVRKTPKHTAAPVESSESAAAESAAASESASATESSTAVESAVEAESTGAESAPKAPAPEGESAAEPAKPDGKTAEAEASKPTKPAERKTAEAEEEEDVVPLPIDEVISEIPAMGLKTVVAALLEQASVDGRVVLGHVEQAKRSLEDEEDAVARQYVRQAQRATTFVGAGLPTVLARECLDRAVVESQGGRPSRATESIRAAVSIANQVPLKGTVEQFRRRGAQAVKAIEEEQPERARELLRQMVQMVDTSDAELEMDRLCESLRAVLSAIDRDARKAALAELEGADDALRTILKTFREE